MKFIMKIDSFPENFWSFLAGMVSMNSNGDKLEISNWKTKDFKVTFSDSLFPECNSDLV